MTELSHQDKKQSKSKSQSTDTRHSFIGGKTHSHGTKFGQRSDGLKCATLQGGLARWKDGRGRAEAGAGMAIGAGIGGRGMEKSDGDGGAREGRREGNCTSASEQMFQLARRRPGPPAPTSLSLFTPSHFHFHPSHMP